MYSYSIACFPIVSDTKYNIQCSWCIVQLVFKRCIYVNTLVNELCSSTFWGPPPFITYCKHTLVVDFNGGQTNFLFQPPSPRILLSWPTLIAKIQTITPTYGCVLAKLVWYIDFVACTCEYQPHLCVHENSRVCRPLRYVFGSNAHLSKSNIGICSPM